MAETAPSAPVNKSVPRPVMVAGHAPLVGGAATITVPGTMITANSLIETSFGSAIASVATVGVRGASNGNDHEIILTAFKTDGTKNAAETAYVRWRVLL